MKATNFRNYPRASLKAGQVLFSEGDIGEEMYFIEKGQLQVYKKIIEGAEKVLASLGPGDYFGEMSILTGERRSATVRAEVDSELVVIGKVNFKELIMEMPEIALDLMGQMSMRIKEVDEQLILTSLELALINKRPQTAQRAEPAESLLLSGSFEPGRERAVLEAARSFEEKPKRLDILARFYRPGRHKEALIYAIPADSYDFLMELLSHFGGLLTWEVSPAMRLDRATIEKLAEIYGQG